MIEESNDLVFKHLSDVYLLHYQQQLQKDFEDIKQQNIVYIPSKPKAKLTRLLDSTPSPKRRIVAVIAACLVLVVLVPGMISTINKRFNNKTMSTNNINQTMDSMLPAAPESSESLDTGGSIYEDSARDYSSADRIAKMLTEEYIVVDMEISNNYTIYHITSIEGYDIIVILEKGTIKEQYQDYDIYELEDITLYILDETENYIVVVVEDGITYTLKTKTNLEILYDLVQIIIISD